MVTFNEPKKIERVVYLGNKNGMHSFRFNYFNGESGERILSLDVKMRNFGEKSGIYQGFGFGRTMLLEADSLNEAAEAFKSDLGDSLYRDQVRKSGGLNDLAYRVAERIKAA